MNYEQFNKFCGSFLATTYVMQWGNSHVWKVAGKVFAIGGWSKDKKPAFTFKASEQNYYFLCERPGYIPAPYFANRGLKWIQQIESDTHSNQELEYYLKASYDLVVQGLSKSKQQAFGLESLNNN